MKKIIGVVLSAGKGTRFAHAPWPKALAPIEGAPVVVLQTQKLLAFVEHVVVVTHPETDEQVQAELEPFGDRVITVCQYKPLGTAMAVAAALTGSRRLFFPEALVVMNVDMPLLSTGTIESVVKTITSLHSELVVTTVLPTPELQPFMARFGRVVRRGERIIRIVEADEAGEALRAQQPLLNAGLYGMNVELLDRTLPGLPAHHRGNDPGAPVEFYLTDVVGRASSVDEVPLKDPKEALGMDRYPEDFERVCEIVKTQRRNS